MTDALIWAGTFHGIGARLLREYAEQIGIDPAFTILDREDAADLMNLVLARTRLHEDGEPLSDERYVPWHLFPVCERRDGNRRRA
jgi:superfamily I DNA/RNA helicase